MLPTPEPYDGEYWPRSGPALTVYPKVPFVAGLWFQPEYSFQHRSGTMLGESEAKLCSSARHKWRGEWLAWARRRCWRVPSPAGGAKPTVRHGEKVWIRFLASGSSVVLSAEWTSERMLGGVRSIGSWTHLGLRCRQRTVFYGANVFDLPLF